MSKEGKMLLWGIWLWFTLASILLPPFFIFFLIVGGICGYRQYRQNVNSAWYYTFRLIKSSGNIKDKINFRLKGDLEKALLEIFESEAQETGFKKEKWNQFELIVFNQITNKVETYIYKQLKTKEVLK